LGAALLGGEVVLADEAVPPGDTAPGTGVTESELQCPHPFLTPADDFYTVARGEPVPHSLTGEALVAARMTPETWLLEITADATVDPPHVNEPASIERSLNIADGTALNLPALIELGAERRVRFVKALQCLNIPTPLGQGLWEGVPLRDVLALCGRMNNVRRIYFRGFHNNDPAQIFQGSLSYTQVMETPPGEFPVFIAYLLNGEPISPLRGGPARMIVPWTHGFKNIKWLQQIFVTNDYRANDTYALQNNDPEAGLKTAAFVDEISPFIAFGETVTATGHVISGMSGVDRVEYWLRTLTEDSRHLPDDDPELLAAPWQTCELFPAPDWSAVLPGGVEPATILGFDRQSGRPSSWPMRFGMASWAIQFPDLPRGRYELRARAVDLNGYAQPEPRPSQKSGQNAIQIREFEVL
jgi:DMSO/TMAO reductase YedYZ molybdopterin-dependent catalytic subunit